MAATANVSDAERSELACAYAALVLQDSGNELSSDNINKLLDASGNKVESYWPPLFAKAVASVNLVDLLSNVGGGGAAAAGPAAAADGDEKKEEEAEEEKEPEEEEADVGVRGMFGEEGDDYY